MGRELIFPKFSPHCSEDEISSLFIRSSDWEAAVDFLKLAWSANANREIKPQYGN